MMTGSAFYDPAFVNGLLEWIGFDQRFDAATLVKVPVGPTLVSSFIVLFASLGMTDGMQSEHKHSTMDTVHESFRKTKQAPYGSGTPSPLCDSVGLYGLGQCHPAVPDHWGRLLEGHRITFSDFWSCCLWYVPHGGFRSLFRKNSL